MRVKTLANDIGWVDLAALDAVATGLGADADFARSNLRERDSIGAAALFGHPIFRSPDFRHR